MTPLPASGLPPAPVFDPSASPPPQPSQPPFYRSLYFWVLVGVAAGVVFGVMFPTPTAPPGQPPAAPGLAERMKPLGEGFINLIKMLIAPIIFCTVVAGIAGAGDLRKVGRVGLKALVYFELITTLAMCIALAVVHLAQPGAGVRYQPSAADLHKIESYNAEAAKQSAADFILHLIPKTFVGAFVEGDILQVLLVSILAGAALAGMGERAAPLIHGVQLVGQMFFGIVGIVVKLAPLAAFGAMSATVGGAGLGALWALAGMMLCFYATCLLFIFGVLSPLAFCNGFRFLAYLRFIKDEILLVLGTSSSESALPPLMAKLERAGCARNVVGIVLPAGYSFNLDGTSIYLALAVVFLAQATHTPLSFAEEMGLLGLLLLTSKGAAAVTGGGFITLSATLAATHHPALLAGLAMLIGIDRFMSEARAITNLIGNGLATLIIAKSEGALDPALARELMRK